MMNLEIKGIYSDQINTEELPEDLYNFNIPLRVEIGEKDKAGSEAFHFVAASASGLESECSGNEFKLLRGYILMERFDWKTVRRSIENIINHARGYSDNNWNEVVDFFSRHARYDSEDIH
jgi:hypothetical protein